MDEFMSVFALGSIAIAASLALIGLGGGLYEVAVVDPAWPSRPDIIQPDRGGISRKRFWIIAHTAFELFLVAALVIAWSIPEIRFWLLVALGSHAVMRIWSFVDFIPNALAYERADPATVDSSARAWTKRSRLRLLLDIVTCFAMMSAFSQRFGFYRWRRPGGQQNRRS
jgi:hypothetical protein